MENSVELDKRVSVLENSMDWAQGSIGKIGQDLDTLKNGQIQLIERISSLQAHTDEKFIGIHEKFASMQAHTDEQFVGVHKEISGVHKEITSIHRAISVQTKWMLAAILAASVLISVVQPLLQKLL